LVNKDEEEEKVSGRNKITRRRFLALLGGAVGAAALGCCGLTALSTRQPPVEVTRSNCEGDGVEKILVAYASKAGSTGEVAKAIGQALCDGSVAVDVEPVREVGDLSGYGAVVVGSAVRMGRRLPEATKFIEAHRAILDQVPTAYFLCCGTLQDDTEENRREAASWLAPVRQIVTPVSEGLFAGKIDFDKLSFLDRTIAKMVGSTEGDWRDWDAIHAWADGLLTMGFKASA
jgi:menaquinone-dependent protoporphyrinogen oxidase